jgi:hypothetical protein
MKSASIDFAALNRRAVKQLPAMLMKFLPGGLVRGQEYIARNPTRPDHHLGSFKINLQTGRWADFATGDAGGDIISLIAYVNRIGQLDAARLLLEVIGGGHV